MSVLVDVEGETVRRDFSSEAWEGPPEGALGWWRCVAGGPAAPTQQRSPSDVLLDLFDAWSPGAADQTGQPDARYVAAMLLVRRRVFRADDAQEDPAVLTVECPRRSETYQVPVNVPDETRAGEIEALIDAALNPEQTPG
ncbi:hypothetical protein [Pirellulimonas nuda]|uniref:hypothetical protein n=1 Tax=Pirellulimonas nuda TaxID=2528009 RepID=UPI0011AA9A8D|nr:hypothetical protein [Pirellulimonas nuda]